MNDLFSNFIVFGDNLIPASPGSDLVFSTGKSSIYWGRDGNDTILSFDPSANSLLQVDLLLGDLVDATLFPNLGDTPRDWQNRFILGDWQQPYYVSSLPLIFGLNQSAVIADFNPSQDIIQLHGTPEDYQLVTTPVGTALLWRQFPAPDLIAFLPLVSDLNLEDDYFEFQGNNPPEGPVLEEIQQLGTAGFDGFSSSATDALGNLYVTGSTGGNAWVTKFDSNGNQLWSQEFGTSSVESATGIVTDREGNSYLVGVTQGDLGGVNAGSFDVWLTKFDSDGNQLWLEQLGNELVDLSYSIDIDVDGNVYLSGHSGKRDEESPLGQTLDTWVAKYDKDGNQNWFRDSEASAAGEAYGVAVGSDNSIYTTGWTIGNVGGENAGLYDIWLSKYDSEGNPVWTQQFGSEDYEFPWGMDTDSEDNIYITGWTLGDLGGANAGSYDAWVAKYDSNGDRQWIEQFGTSEDDGLFLGGIEVDSNDDIFLTGYTDGDLGGENAGSSDVWVAKYDSNGDRQWIQQFGTSELDYPTDLIADTAGNLYAIGLTEGSLGNINAGAVDGWIAKLDAESGILQDFSGMGDSLYQLE
ncbi:SBBP repeat-containing protein [Pleurocapsales cyanobacterium LEGE 06147]|nr:SBBP repeat-containing protein [Pleurocapsales cyanobacterium LEGE 06147]